MSFYNLTKDNIEYLQYLKEKTSAKLAEYDTNTSTSQLYLNRKKHLQECLNSISECLQGSDTDKYDYFLDDIYDMVWGNSSPNEVVTQTMNKVDKFQPNIPTLKEIAQTVLKSEVETHIGSSSLWIERMKEYTENGVPKVISIRQAKLALLEADLLDDVEEFISKTDDKRVKISWEYATDFDRYNDIILALQKQLGLTNQEVDDLFIKAKTL
ncbi:TPA: hypothetical protein SFZ51_001119 [Campylobacter jejuni]|nr:hypothetical protein [Campylobacter jejuni]HEG8105708.1 hypothetical protein [Campylobacter jejuni]HEG8133946.1 hypothetical protein [Campylobacter jejuni]